MVKPIMKDIFFLGQNLSRQQKPIFKWEEI